MCIRLRVLSLGVDPGAPGSYTGPYMLGSGSYHVRNKQTKAPMWPPSLTSRCAHHTQLTLTSRLSAPSVSPYTLSSYLQEQAYDHWPHLPSMVRGGLASYDTTGVESMHVPDTPHATNCVASWLPYRTHVRVCVPQGVHTASSCVQVYPTMPAICVHFPCTCMA